MHVTQNETSSNENWCCDKNEVLTGTVMQEPPMTTMLMYEFNQYTFPTAVSNHNKPFLEPIG